MQTIKIKKKGNLINIFLEQYIIYYYTIFTNLFIYLLINIADRLYIYNYCKQCIKFMKFFKLFIINK